MIVKNGDSRKPGDLRWYTSYFSSFFQASSTYNCLLHIWYLRYNLNLMCIYYPDHSALIAIMISSLSGLIQLMFIYQSHKVQSRCSWLGFLTGSFLSGVIPGSRLIPSCGSDIFHHIASMMPWFGGNGGREDGVNVEKAEPFLMVSNGKWHISFPFKFYWQERIVWPHIYYTVPWNLVLLQDSLTQWIISPFRLVIYYAKQIASEVKGLKQQQKVIFSHSFCRLGILQVRNSGGA